MVDLLDPAHFGTLRREERVPKSYKVVGFDSEDDTHGTPVAFSFWDGEKSFYTKDWRKALQYVLDYPIPAVFCAHNLEYDIGNLFKASTFRLVDQMVYASRLLRVSLKFSKHYFLNSAAFFPGSLKQMGEVVGLKKLDGGPFDRDYAERDPQIVHVFMEKLQQRLLKDYGAGLGVSIGQVSMDIYRRSFLPVPKQVTWCHPAGLTAYYGGRVEMFYKGLLGGPSTLKGPINVADFNSCYPYVMRNRPYPDTSMLQKSGLDKDTFGIGKYSVMVPKNLFVPPLPYRSDTRRLFFPTGLMTGWWTFAEIRRAEELGCKVVREWEAIGTSGMLKPFDTFVDHFYGLREKTKPILKANPGDENASFDNAYYKLVMNNLYGKLSAHKASKVLSRTPLPPVQLKAHPDVKVNKIGPFWSYTLTRAKAPPTANYMWGLYVTAYSRLHLLDHLIKVRDTPGCQLVYCDTDSIMYTGHANLSFGKALGEMSLETYDLGIFRASKGYLLCNQEADGAYKIEKVACKGVPTSSALDFVTRGVSKTFRKPMRLKEGLIQLRAHHDGEGPVPLTGNKRVKRKQLGEDIEKEIGINVWGNVRKEMRSIYIKRKGAQGVTVPIDVDDIPKAELQAMAHTEANDMALPDDLELRNKWTENTNFLDVKIPPGWFEDEPPARRSKRVDMESVRPHYLRAIECQALQPGEVWVAGTIFDIEVSPKGETYKLNVHYYLDDEVEAGSMVALLNPRYLYQESCDKDLIGQQLDITLKTEYIEKRAVNLRIEISETRASESPE